MARELVGRSDAFVVGARVTFWTQVDGGRPGDVIRHVWIHEGQQTNIITLSIGGAVWRTQSRKTLSPGEEGDWIAEARDAAGRVLARQMFRCDPQ